MKLLMIMDQISGLRHIQKSYSQNHSFSTSEYMPTYADGMAHDQINYVFDLQENTLK